MSKYMTKEESGTTNKKVKKHSDKLIEYINHALTDPERGVSRTFFDSLRERNNITEPEELMMLDIVVHDFIRIKILQILINKK